MQEQIYHNSHDLFFRSPFGALSCGQKVILRLQVEAGLSVEKCILRLWEEGKEKLLHMTQRNSILLEHQVFEVQYSVPDNPGLVWYFFIIQGNTETYYYGNNDEHLGGVGRVWDFDPPAYQITVYQPMEVPSWFREGVMYQIFVDRFFNGNEKGEILNPRKRALIHANWYDTPFYIKDEKGRVIRWNFFGGNLKGVIKKLPYLKELGVTILYLNPIFDSPSNHKYDTADYKRIDPMYGDTETFETLIKEAKAQGFSVLLDGVFSHTGSDSLYFNKYGNYSELGAYESKDSLYFQWYKWKDNGECVTWWGVENLPEVNELELSYRDFIYNAEDSVIKTWMSKGIQGWRLDVADELPDEFIQELRQTMKQINPNSILIGEVWEDASNKESYGKLREYFWGQELDSTMNYPFREIFLQFLLGQINAEQVHKRVMSLYENYPRENFYAAMNLIGSHDRARILTLLGNAPPAESLTIYEQERYKLSEEARELAIRRLKLLTLVQMCFPGVPCIYYGDEAGLEGYTDPFNRGTYPWGKENLEVLEWYKRVLRFRQEYEVLQKGDFVSFTVGEDVYGFKRFIEKEEIVIVINCNLLEVREFELKHEEQSPYRIIDLLEGKIVSERKVLIPPLTGKVLFCQKELEEGPYSQQEKFKRSCGVLMHISSLPSLWGIGDLGQEAYKFVDFLVESGQSLWQVLPLNPVGLGFSPYQSDSAFAGNSLFISIEHLLEEGLLTQVEVQGAKEVHSLNSSHKKAINEEGFNQVKSYKTELLRLASRRFDEIMQVKSKTCCDFEGNQGYLSLQNYQAFQEQNSDWLKDYTLYKSLKENYAELPWYEWEYDLAFREPVEINRYSKSFEEEIAYHTFVQYTFEFEWQSLKNYANQRGIKIIGDMPIFVATDSCDTWVHRKFFNLDDKNRPIKVAGVPPDYFSSTGQLWGNPVYDWRALEESDYSWWKLRMKQALHRFDVLRLDHFRGFEAYWEIPAEEKTAVNGRWMKGPGKRFFESLMEELGPLPLIAEDLGIITPEVNTLKLIFGFPGMRVLQFNSLEEFEQEPNTNCVYYTGTHDNDTFLAWYKTTQNHKELYPEDEYVKWQIERLYESQAIWVILPLQDILGLDQEARMNTPGTIEGNWQWSVEKERLNPEIREWLQNLAKKYSRTQKA